MANDPLALSGITSGLPQEADYDAVYAAVTATDRGRWFLAEFASRNRHADTGSLIAAIARIEAAVRSDGAGRERIGRPDISAVAERLADIAFGLRERAADAALCDALDAAVREICDTCTNGTATHDADSVASPTAAVVLASIEGASAAGHRLEAGASGGDDDSGSDPFDLDLHDSDKLAKAAAALGASLSSLNDKIEPTLEPRNEPASESRSSSLGAVIPRADYESVAESRPAEAADYTPRWRIEAPDFVFHRPKPQANGRDVESFGQSNQAHSLLPGPQLLPSPEEDPADLFEPAPKRVAVPPHSVPATPAPAASAPSDVVQAMEIPSPVSPAVRPMPRPAPVNPLAALRALSEDELIALFG